MTRHIFLFAGLLTLASFSSRAAPPEAPSKWREALAPNLSGACIDVLEGFLTPTGDVYIPPPGKQLDHNSPPSDPTLLPRLNTQGGLPYYSPNGKFVRISSKYDELSGTWSPQKDTGLANRGLFELEVPGHRLIGFDHISSPITSATTLWEDLGGRVTLVAHFPGEIVTVEDRSDRVVLHVTDNMNAIGVEWDKKASKLVGTCLIDTRAVAALPEPIDILGTVPTALEVKRKTSLYLQNPMGEPEAPYIIGKVLPRTKGFVLYERPDRWVLVLVPLPDRSPQAKLFQGLPQRTWTVGWLAPDTR
jgi:hypothetical protein